MWAFAVIDGGDAAASEKLKCVFSAQAENDLFGNGEDSHFTHGTRFSLLVPASLDAEKNDCFIFQRLVKNGSDAALKLLPGFLVPRKNRLSFIAGQNIFTPEDITQFSLIQNDRPFAGWLYAGFGLVTEADNRRRQGNQTLENLELNLGIVGPSAYADEVQSEWHSLINTRTPNGWDNQLKDEIGVLLTYERKWPMAERQLSVLSYDVAPGAGFAVGNVYTYGAAGATLRFGQDLPNDYGPPRIRPGLQGGGFFEPKDGFGWYFFAGIEGRAIARNIFLDGNTFRNSHSVDKNPLVGDFQAGLVLAWPRVQLSFTNVFRTKEFDGQKKIDEFGSINLSVRF